MVSVQDTLTVRAWALNDAVTPSATGMVTVVDLEQERDHRDLGEILGSTAGFQVRRYGGLGFAAVPSLRGSAAAQIRVFVDGMPLNDAQSGNADLSLLPVDRFSRIEIHRGVVPGALGGMGGAGAVNLITRRHTRGLSVGAFNGGFGHRGGRLSWGGTSSSGKRSLLLTAHGQRADNNYQYLDNYQTFDQTADDTLRVRQNAGFEQWGLWGSGHCNWGAVDLSGTAGWFRKDGGRPGPVNFPSPSASVRLERTDGQARLTLPSAALALELASSRVEQFLFDPANEIDDGFGGDIRSLSGDLTGRLVWNPELWLAGSAAALVSGVRLMAGVEERSQWYRQWYGQAQDPRRQRRTTTLFGSLPVGLLADRLQLTPAWRWQRNRDDFPPLPALPWLPEQQGVEHSRDDASPSVGLVWEAVRETWFVEAHAGRSVRVPTWVELFGHRGGVDGNRELQPEEISSRDLAVVWRPEEGTSLRLGVFSGTTDQTIVFVQNSPGTSRASNIGATRNQGLESELHWTLPEGFQLRANWTWQQPRDRGLRSHLRGNRLPFLGDAEGHVSLIGTAGRWRGRLDWSYQGERYRDRENTERLKASPRNLWNLALTRQLGDQLEASVEVINLTDNRDYDLVQFPLPGRTWQFSLALNP